MYSTARHHASPIQCYPPTTNPSYRHGEILISILPGRLIISEVALTESEGAASHELAERLRPELQALDRAARRLAGGVK